jgi:hypothetical protein
MNRLFCFLFVMTCWSCTQYSQTEKYQKKRNNVLNVRDKVKELLIEDVFISNISYPYIIGGYFIVRDYNSHDKLVHIFDKNEFNYITSIAQRGEGPGEILNIGYIATDEANRRFYVSDWGKQKIFSYDLDSILNPLYIPEVKIETNIEGFPLEYLYINDTLCIGSVVEPIGNSDYKQLVAKWNMATGEIKPMIYEHPEIEKKRISFAVSAKYGVYVECYSHHDLMTLCSLDGELKYNIYGKKWNNRKTNAVSFYGDVMFCNDKIVAIYSPGEDRFGERGLGSKVNHPTKVVIFDIEGNYLKTLDIGYSIVNFCYDKENNRIIIHFDDDIQFGYLDLDGVI